jgi:hypothetical protein
VCSVVCAPFGLLSVFSFILDFGLVPVFLLGSSLQLRRDFFHIPAAILTSQKMNTNYTTFISPTLKDTGASAKHGT